MEKNRLVLQHELTGSVLLQRPQVGSWIRNLRRYIWKAYPHYVKPCVALVKQVLATFSYTEGIRIWGVQCEPRGDALGVESDS